MSIGLKSAFCHDSDEPGGFDRIDEGFHNSQERLVTVGERALLRFSH